VDASQIISKVSPWNDRDKAIEKGLEKFNNEMAKKFWYGYKRNLSVCMKLGLLTKSVVFADKSYCGKHPSKIMQRNGYVNKAILKTIGTAKILSAMDGSQNGVGLSKGSFLNSTNRPTRGCLH